jgi:H+/gluconate symporter-like permease
MGGTGLRAGGAFEEDRVTVQAIGIFAVFLGFAGLMVAGRLPALLALPGMAVAIAAVAGMPATKILDDVVAAGSVKLAAAIAAVTFGGMLAQVVRRSGVAEAIVKRVAELSGENTLIVSMAVAAACTLLFMTLGGLGAVILVASLAFPVLLAAGVPPLTTGCLFLIAMSVGGILNVANWQLYIDVLHLSQAEVRRFALLLFVPGALTVAAFVVWEIALRGRRRRMWAVGTDAPPPRIAGAAYATPLVPLILVIAPAVLRPITRAIATRMGYEGEALDAVLGWEFPIVPAMLIGVVWGVLTAPRPANGRVQLASAVTIEGLRDVAPAIVLIMGIGMLFLSVSSEHVKACLVTTDPATGVAGGPLSILRTGSPVAFVLVWSVLAPLALYRGPLNVWGMGFGIAGLLMAGNALPAAAIMAGLMAVGQVQGISDPTNTHNVWVAGTLSVEVQQILRRTLPFAWGLAIVGLVIGACLFQ